MEPRDYEVAQNLLMEPKTTALFFKWTFIHEFYNNFYQCLFIIWFGTFSLL